MVLPFLFWTSHRLYHYYTYQARCADHLVHAATSCSIALAKQELQTAVTYLEATGRTNGHTSIFCKTPDEDVGFWFQNLKAAQHELERVTATASPLYRTTLLLKLHETILHHEEKFNMIEPWGISIFPNNVGYAQAGVLYFILACVGLGILSEDC